MAEGQSSGVAEFLYREGRTFYFNVNGSVYGFIPDCGIKEDDYEKVLQTALTEGKVNVEFVTRTSVMTSRPKCDKHGEVFSESYTRLKETEPGVTNEGARRFLAGYRLGHDRGYNQGMRDALENERHKDGR